MEGGSTNRRWLESKPKKEEERDRERMKEQNGWREGGREEEVKIHMLFSWYIVLSRRPNTLIVNDTFTLISSLQIVISSF